jgi:hypothetical protein
VSLTTEPVARLGEHATGLHAPLRLLIVRHDRGRPYRAFDFVHYRRLCGPCTPDGDQLQLCAVEAGAEKLVALQESGIFPLLLIFYMILTYLLHSLDRKTIQLLPF